MGFRVLPKLALTLLVAVVTPIVIADEGRIPIYQPVSITTGGSYIVTRDVGVESDQPVIVVVPVESSSTQAA